MHVVDWATLMQRRNDPALWDIYITHSAVPARADAVAAAARRRRAGLVETRRPRTRRSPPSTRSPIPTKRGALWGKVQQVVYDEVPYIRGRQFQQR